MLTHVETNARPSPVAILSVAEASPMSFAYMLMLANVIQATFDAKPESDGMHLGPSDCRVAVAGLRIAAASLARTQANTAPNPALA